MEKKTPKKINFKIELTVGSNVYNGKGETVYEAFKDTKAKEFKAMGRLKVNGKAIPVRLTALHLKRLFNNDTTLEIFSKRVNTLA